jgi:hypothetical protein
VATGVDDFIERFFRVLAPRCAVGWKGFSGGDEAWSEIETFFATARRRETVETTGEIG